MPPALFWYSSFNSHFFVLAVFCIHFPISSWICITIQCLIGLLFIFMLYPSPTILGESGGMNICPGMSDGSFLLFQSVDLHVSLCRKCHRSLVYKIIYCCLSSLAPKSNWILTGVKDINHICILISDHQGGFQNERLLGSARQPGVIGHKGGSLMGAGPQPLLGTSFNSMNNMVSYTL